MCKFSENRTKIISNSKQCLSTTMMSFDANLRLYAPYFIEASGKQIIVYHCEKTDTHLFRRASSAEKFSWI